MCVCATFPFLTTGIACIHPTDKNKANLAKPKDISPLPFCPYRHRNLEANRSREERWPIRVTLTVE